MFDKDGADIDGNLIVHVFGLYQNKSIFDCRAEKRDQTEDFVEVEQ